MNDHKWVFHLDPYDKDAKFVLDYLRKHISPNYRLQVRGRGRRSQPGDSQTLPLERADKAVVYIWRKDRNVKDTGIPVLPEAKDHELEEAWEEGGGSLGDQLDRLHKGASV